MVFLENSLREPSYSQAGTPIYLTECYILMVRKFYGALNKVNVSKLLPGEERCKSLIPEIKFRFE